MENYKKKTLTGKCSYCSKKIDSKYTACFLCNKQKQKRPIIPNCADCGINKDSVYKYCINCYPKHKDEWKKNKNVDNNNNEL